MKYAKKLDEILSRYPWYLRVRCISYRKWKKFTPTKNWRLWLLWDFLKSPKRLFDLNLMTLYKICKRIEKRFGVEGMVFFTRVSKTFSPEANETLHVPEDGQNTE